jgi:hypothetical protein
MGGSDARGIFGHWSPDPNSQRPPIATRASKDRQQKHRLTISPEQLREMQLLIKRLGRAAGLEDRLTAYALRRGVAYTLATKTSKENRRFLMGHKTASRIYSEYASKIATVDLGAFYRNQEPRSLAPMIGMLLNRRDDAPQSISDAGLAHTVGNTQSSLSSTQNTYASAMR